MLKGRNISKKFDQTLKDTKLVEIRMLQRKRRFGKNPAISDTSIYLAWPAETGQGSSLRCARKFCTRIGRFYLTYLCLSMTIIIEMNELWKTYQCLQLVQSSNISYHNITIVFVKVGLCLNVLHIVLWSK